jgi:hypothetical protein
MQCSCCLEILNNLILEFVFSKWSSIGKWSTGWGLGGLTYFLCHFSSPSTSLDKLSALCFPLPGATHPNWPPHPCPCPIPKNRAPSSWSGYTDALATQFNDGLQFCQEPEHECWGYKEGESQAWTSHGFSGKNKEVLVSTLSAIAMIGWEPLVQRWFR